MGPLLNFEDGLNPSTGSTFSARFSSTSPIDFMCSCKTIHDLNILQQDFCLELFPQTHREVKSVGV